jgi:hypothetical protein
MLIRSAVMLWCIACISMLTAVCPLCRPRWAEPVSAAVSPDPAWLGLSPVPAADRRSAGRWTRLRAIRPGRRNPLTADRQSVPRLSDRPQARTDGESPPLWARKCSYKAKARRYRSSKRACLVMVLGLPSVWGR